MFEATTFTKVKILCSDWQCVFSDIVYQCFAQFPFCRLFHSSVTGKWHWGLRFQRSRALACFLFLLFLLISAGWQTGWYELIWENKIDWLALSETSKKLHKAIQDLIFLLISVTSTSGFPEVLTTLSLFLFLSSFTKALVLRQLENPDCTPCFANTLIPKDKT